MTELINWLLEDKNPAVKYRTQTELLGQNGDKRAVIEWITEKLPENWQETKGLWYRYYVTALAECGLSYEDIPTEKFATAFTELTEKFDCNCGDFMLLTALMKLGYAQHPVIENTLDHLRSCSLPDGGYLCLHRVNKLKYTPKSCYKADLHALMFFAECKKNRININDFQPLIDYFLNRNIFYKTTEPDALVLGGREGWRTVDTFYPFEVMRVGIQNVVEAFAALGYGNDERLKEAWGLLCRCRDETGKILLKGTLTKSYLPKERVGKPSKWVTFYTLLAEQHRKNYEG